MFNFAALKSVCENTFSNKFLIGSFDRYQKLNMNFQKIIYTLIFVFSATFSVSAQDFFNGDLSNIKVDNISEGDIAKLKTQLQAKGTTMEQAEPMALSRGMKPAEFAKLKIRVGTVVPAVAQAAATSDGTRKQDDVMEQSVKSDTKSTVFGSELFTGTSLTFEPNLKMATPVNYILGPGDELQISVFGVQEMNSSAALNSEGKINIPFVGQMMISGMPIEAATQKIKSALARIYTTIGSGQSQVGISLSKIRTIKITLIGAKQPGNYSVSSLSSVYNALYAGGGPAANGSYRNIELLRNNKVIRNIDIYRFLVNGDQSDNVGLKDNDVIRIPVYLHRVTLSGEVVRQGIFEMKSGETFDKLIGFASGFTDLAYKATVNVIKKTEKEFKVAEIKSDQFKLYLPMNGDEFRVTKILNRFENKITISGAVFRPDVYAFADGMKIKELLNKADGLKEDAYLQRAVIMRLKPDFTTVMLDVDLAAVLGDNQEANILLKKEDIVTVYSIFDLKENFKVSIDGEVKKPGSYPFSENLTLNDLLLRSGGLTNAASKKVEIARMIKAEVLNDTNPAKIELLTINIDNNTNEQAQNIVLRPFDVISVRRIVVYNVPETIVLKGSVVYPGTYAITNKKEKIYDVIMRAGGLLSTANVNAVCVKRPIQKKQIDAISEVNLNLGKGDLVQNELTKKVTEELQYLTIPIEWEQIRSNKNSSTNITLFAGDEVEVGVFSESVKVVGNVLLNSEIPYQSGRGFNYYINAVGGIDFKGWKQRAYIIYPNGKAAVTKHFLFFRSYPTVMPGSQIVIPEKPEKPKTNATEIISIASVLASLAGVIIAIIRR